MCEEVGCFADLIERWPQHVADNGDSLGGREVVKVEAFVEAAVDLAASAVTRLVVDVDRVGSKFDAGAEDVSAECQFGGGVGQAGLDAGSFESDGVTAFVDLGTGQCAVGSEVDEAFFAGVQFGQLLGERGVQVVGELLLLGHGAVEQVGDGGREIGGDLQGGVVASDGFFDLSYRQVRQVALLELAAAADVVAVVVAAAASGFGVDEPVGAAGFVAAVAEQVALEVVGQYPVALTALRAFVEHDLNAVEELLADDGLMSAGVELAVDYDPTGVVRVGQHLVQLVGRDGFALGPGLGGPGHQAEVGHGFVEVINRVVAAGIQFPGLPHERRTDRVEADGVVEAAVLFGADVEVADLGAGDGAAVDGFVAELGFDVLTVAADFDLVEDVGDGFHGIGHVALTEVFFGGDELNAQGSELPFGEDGVAEVPEGSRAHVDDHVLDFRMLSDVGEQLTEHRPLLDALGGVTWLDEHLIDLRIHGDSSACGEVSLG